MADESNEFWWWANTDGALKTVEQNELVRELSKGAIAPRTFVWKAGWAEWMRATQVAELQKVLPQSVVGIAVPPKLDPDATHPPPVPVDTKLGGRALDPIIPVASNPENDKPQTALLIDIDLDSGALNALQKEPPPPPSRRSGMNGQNGKSSSHGPIVPVDSNADNDRPDTQMLADSEIMIEEEAPPIGKWEEVQRRSAPPPPSARSAPLVARRIIDVKANQPARAPASDARAAKPEPPRPAPSEPPRPAPSEPPRPATNEPPRADRPAVSAAAALVGRAAASSAAPPPTHTPAVAPMGRTLAMPVEPSPLAAPPAPVAQHAPAQHAPAQHAPTPHAPAQHAPTPHAPVAQHAPAQHAPAQHAPAQHAPTPHPPVAQHAPAQPAPTAHAPVPAAPFAPARTALGLGSTVAIADGPPTNRDLNSPIVPVADPENDGPTIAMEPIIPVSEPENEAPTRIHPAAVKEDAPLPAWDIDPEGTVENAPQWPAPRGQQNVGYGSYPPPKKSRLPLILGGLVVFGALGAIGVGAALYITKPWESADAKKTAATAAAPAPAPTPAEPVNSTAACTIGTPAKKLAGNAVVSVPFGVAAVPGGSAIAVGFADSPTGAAGITIDAKTLATKEPFSRAGTQPVAGVVPLVTSGTLSFEVDRAGGTLQGARTIDAKQPFSVGVGPDGYSRVVANGQPETIWSDAAGEKTTEPRVATLEGVGHVVTFRRGGRDGEIRVGWLTPDGQKKTGLANVSAEGPRVGTPSVAAAEHGVLVAFAARPSDGAPWNVRLAKAEAGALPTKSEPFALPSGGPGTEAISPTAAALPGGRWLLQWTEGKAGERTVRAQTLGADLKPLGNPIELSPKGVEAGQGAIGVAADHAVATFLVKSATGYELWASSLACAK